MIFNISKSAAISESSTPSAAALVNHCQCVAFRLDDIQDYFLTNPQMEVINTFEKEKANLTAGIIGNSFGQDPLIVAFMRGKVINSHSDPGKFFLELANHGWNHEDFTRFNKEQQTALARQTNEKILDIFGEKPIVFIPPYNSLNNNTVAALLENDIHYVSANATSYVPSASSENDSLMFFPSLAVTGDLSRDDTQWLGYSHNETFNAVKESVDHLGYAVITMHPMEFSLRNGTNYQNDVDQNQIRELELLIDDIRASGLKIVTISQIGKVSSGSVPEFSDFWLYPVLVMSVTVSTWFTVRFYRHQLPRNLDG